jgi:hypothetical protein
MKHISLIIGSTLILLITTTGNAMLDFTKKPAPQQPYKLHTTLLTVQREVSRRLWQTPSLGQGIIQHLTTQHFTRWLEKLITDYVTAFVENNQSEYNEKSLALSFLAEEARSFSPHLTLHTRIGDIKAVVSLITLYPSYVEQKNTIAITNTQQRMPELIKTLILSEKLRTKLRTKWEEMQRATGSK